VILAGQSAGAWVSMAAAFRGAPVDGVISVAAAHHGFVRNMRDTSVARSEWQQIVRGIKPGPRLVVVNFTNDDYDVGGRMHGRCARGVRGVRRAGPGDRRPAGLHRPWRGGQQYFPAQVRRLHPRLHRDGSAPGSV
jgi:hypothetical protein